MKEEEQKYYKQTKVSQQDLDEGIRDEEYGGIYSKDGKRFLQYIQPEGLPLGHSVAFSFKPGVMVICENAFGGLLCPKVFEIPQTVVAIGAQGLKNTAPFKGRLVIPKSLKYIGDHVFENEEGIFDIVFEEGLQTLDLGNILDFGAFTSVYLPSTLISIGENGFGECNCTVSIYVAEGNKHLCVEEDVLYDFVNNKLLRCPISKRGHLAVPEGVTVIGRYAFRACGFETDESTVGVPKMSVVLPKSLARIERGAFRHAHLSSLFISSNVNVIEDKAFEDHFIFEIFVSPDNPYYESHCGLLIRVVAISGSFTGQDVSHDYFEVRNHVLIDKVRKTAILAIGFSSSGYNAFVYPITDDEEEEARRKNHDEKNLVVPVGVEIIEGTAFVGCSFNSLEIPEGVTYIDDGAFNYMHAKTIKLPSTLCYINPKELQELFIGQYEGEVVVLIPKGMTGKFKNWGFESWFIKRFVRELDDEGDDVPLIDISVKDFQGQVLATEEDLEYAVEDEHHVKYSKDGKRLMKFDGFHSRLSGLYKVKDGTETICDNATATDRYQYVRAMVVPASVNYIGSCPSFDRLVLCSSNTRFAHHSICLRKNDSVYIPCGSWRYYYDELENARKNASKKTSNDDDLDYRLVELSRGSVVQYLHQQEQILTGVIKNTEQISFYTGNSIKGDVKKEYVCYRDAYRMFFLDTAINYSDISKTLAILGCSYQDICEMFDIRISEIAVNERNKKVLVGKTLGSYVLYHWQEEFSDEFTGEIVEIQREEVLMNRGSIISEEDFNILIELGISVVSIVQDPFDRTLFELVAKYQEYDEKRLTPYTTYPILRQLFPHKKPTEVTDKEKKETANILLALLKALMDNLNRGKEMVLPIKTDDGDLHTIVSEEEEKLASLITEYYQNMIDKVMNCETESDVMSLFPISQSYQKLKSFLIDNQAEEYMIDTLVMPAIGIL